jgi:hypothetical protein
VVVNRVGTSGKDALTGTSNADGLVSLCGNDALSGKGRKDGLCGGPGEDTLKLAGGQGPLHRPSGPGQGQEVRGGEIHLGHRRPSSSWRSS